MKVAQAEPLRHPLEEQTKWQAKNFCPMGSDPFKKILLRGSDPIGRPSFEGFR